MFGEMKDHSSKKEMEIIVDKSLRQLHFRSHDLPECVPDYAHLCMNDA